MAPKLKSFPQIRKLAEDLGIIKLTDPVNEILEYCDRKVKGFLKQYSDCTSLPLLLEIVAERVGTVFEIIETDADIEKIKKKYISKGEKIFVTLAEDLSGDVYGITYKRLKREGWEREFVSVIDCRGSKAAKAYYTKWHELAHLMVLTDQMRLAFRRTQPHVAAYDPEEAMMEVIAGKFGFYAPIIFKHTSGDISFEVIEALRAQLCPDASIQASQINFVKAWPNSCLLLHCELGHKKGVQDSINQQSFSFKEAPKPELRAVRVAQSNSAREAGFSVFPNMRVPKKSVIYRVFNEDLDYAEGLENLSWWKTSDGAQLQNLPINVMAKKTREAVDVLIVPALSSVN